MSLSLLVGTTVVTFVFSIVLYDWNLNFSTCRMNASLECMIFFIRISRNCVVSIHSVFLFLVLSVCWLQYLIVTYLGPSIIIYANKKIALAQYILEVYDTCELDLVKFRVFALDSSTNHCTFTHLSQMGFPINTNWTCPFPF